jgi:hypothetical protein
MISVRLGSNSAMIMISRTSRGNAITMSVNRMIMVSVFPPRYPAIAPSSEPSTIAIATAMNPIASEIRAPKMIRLSTSRPNWSVPSQCSAPGAR